MTENTIQTKQDGPTIVIGTRVNPEFHERIIKLCHKLGYRSVSQFVLQAVIDQVQSVEKEAPVVAQ